MLHDLKSLVGIPALATDGQVGHIRDFFFDDQSWKVQYVVVEVGSWLKRRDVVLPVNVIAKPDWAGKVCHIALSREQIGKSPDVDSEKPVSRQQEIAMQEFFGPLAFWIDTEFGLTNIPAGVRYPVHTAEDPHLRSRDHVLGYHVLATDGEVGVLEGLLLDEASWHLAYLDVKAGGWLQHRSVLIPTRWVDSVSWPQLRIVLHHTKAGT